MASTDEQYEEAIQSCREIFIKKTIDYGTSWRVLRTISIVDQLYIKAKRIRTIQENEVQKINDGIKAEFIGIVNYAVIGLIQSTLTNAEAEDLPVEQVYGLYNDSIAQSRSLMENKNFDYGEAWRDMSQESFTDLILSKLLRIRQILLNKGKTLISEGINANYYDILNYSVFALILIKENKHKG